MLKYKLSWWRLVDGQWRRESKIACFEPNSERHEVSFPKGALNLRVEKWLDDYEVASRESNEKNYGFAIL